MKEVMQILVSMCFLCSSITHSAEYVDSESDSKMAPEFMRFFKAEMEIERLSKEIEHTDFVDRYKSHLLLIDRGILLLLVGEYQNALNDFNQVLSSRIRNFRIDEITFARSLWGRTLCNAFLEKKEEFIHGREKTRFFRAEMNRARR